MSKDVMEWFFYNGEAQVGPISEQILIAQIKAGLITQNDYIYKEGFNDWKLILEEPYFAKFFNNQLSEKRLSSFRVPMQEIVIAHNDKHIATGTIKNISETGVFFETKQEIFDLNENVKLTLKDGKSLGKPFHLKAKIVRHAVDEFLAHGYGLKLRDVDENIKKSIDDYIKKHQQAS